MATGGDEEEDKSLTMLEAPLENIGEDSDLLQDTQEETEESQKKLSILVIGETGVGKSTLINSLLGLKEKKAKVTHGPDATKHKPITRYTGKVGNTDVLIYDTRGLADGDPKTRDRWLLQKFEEVFVDECIDLVFVCHPMFERFDESAIRTVKLFARKLAKIWERCIFVLTKSNQYYFDDDENEEDEEEPADPSKRDTVKMAKVILTCTLRFKECLEKHGIQKQIIDDIPVCPAGIKKDIALPVTENWIEDLLQACHHRCPHEKKFTFMGIMRMRRHALHCCMNIGLGIGYTVCTIGIIIGLIASGPAALPSIVINTAFTLGVTAAIGMKTADKTSKMVEKKLEEKSDTTQTSTNE